MEKFTANNMAYLYRRHGVLEVYFYKDRDKFIESWKKGFYSLSRSRDYEFLKENEKPKRLVGDQS